MIQISVDPSERVFVHWHEGGQWTVLDRDGSVTEDSTDLTATPWTAFPDEAERNGAYEEGRADGYDEACDDALDEINSLSGGLRKRRVTLKSASATAPPRPASRTVQTANVPGGAL